MPRLRLELPEVSEADGRHDRTRLGAGPSGHVDSPGFAPRKSARGEGTPNIIRWFSAWASGKAEEA